jgi:hypothetical protein
VEATGSDGLDGVKEELNEGKVQFAYVRYIIKNVPKFVYIAWCGPTVTGMLRGSFNNHTIDFANFIKVKKIMRKKICFRRKITVKLILSFWHKMNSQSRERDLSAFTSFRFPVFCAHVFRKEILSMCK